MRDTVQDQFVGLLSLSLQARVQLVNLFDVVFFVKVLYQVLVGVDIVLQVVLSIEWKHARVKVFFSEGVRVQQKQRISDVYVNLKALSLHLIHQRPCIFEPLFHVVFGYVFQIHSSGVGFYQPIVNVFRNLKTVEPRLLQSHCGRS